MIETCKNRINSSHIAKQQKNMYQKWSKIWTIILVIKQGSSTIYCPSQPSIMKCEIQILYQQLKYVLKLVLVIDDCELIQKGSKAKITKVANIAIKPNNLLGMALKIA